MARDAIVAETRRTRNRLAKAHGYDLGKISRALRDEEARGNRRVVSLPAKKARKKRAV